MKRVISWMSWGLILLGGLVSCAVVAGRWGGTQPAAPKNPVAVTTPPAILIGFPVGVPQNVTLDLGTLKEETGTSRQHDDQARDWLMWVVATSLVPDAGQLSDMLFDAPVARKGHLQAVSRMDYGTTRSFVLPRGDVVALVPEADALQREDHLAQVFDDQRRNLAGVPARILVYEYALTSPNKATITRGREVDGQYFLTAESGYLSTVVNNVEQLQEFMRRTDDLLVAQVTPQGLKVSGRRMHASYRNIGPTEVAALWQAEQAIKEANNPEFAEESSALLAKANSQLRDFQVSMLRRNALDDMLVIRAEKERLEREVARGQRALRERYIAAGKNVPGNGTGFSLDPIHDHRLLAEELESDAELHRITSKNEADRERLEEAIAALKVTPGDEDLLLQLGGDLDLRVGDPDAKEASELIGFALHNSGLQRARYDGPLAGTEAGMILFYTDLLAKLWALDFQGSAPAVIEDFIPYAKTRVSHVYDAENIKLSNTRLWFGPERAGFETVGEDQLLLGRIATRIYAASANTFSPGKEGEPNAESDAFLKWWNDHYDEVAHYEPEYQRLNQLMKWSLLIAWLEKQQSASQLGFLAATNVDRSAWFPDWMRQNSSLRFNRWESDPFRQKGYLGNRTEVMVLLESRPYLQAHRVGPGVHYAVGTVSGGVTLASKDQFLAPHRNVASVPLHQRRAGIGRVDGADTAKLSGERMPLYERTRTDSGTGDGSTGVRASQTMTPREAAKLRGPSGDMSRDVFERRVERIGDRTLIMMSTSNSAVGTLAIKPLPDGFLVQWNSRDADAAYVLGRRLSERPQDWRHVLDDPSVAHAARTESGEYYVNLHGSNRWILLSPQEQTVPDIGAGWSGRVSAEDAHAPTYNLRLGSSGPPPGVRERAHWVRGPPPFGALGLRLPKEASATSQDAAQIAEDAVAWRSRKRAEFESTLASLDAMGTRSPRAAIDYGLEAQAALTQRPELLLREAVNELIQDQKASALATMNRFFEGSEKPKRALLDEVNSRMAGLQGAPRNRYEVFSEALHQLANGGMPADSKLRMVDTGSDGPGIGSELRLGELTSAQRVEVGSDKVRQGDLYVQDSVALNSMDWGSAPGGTVDGVIRTGMGTASSIPMGALGDYRPHRIVVDNIVYIHRQARSKHPVENVTMSKPEAVSKPIPVTRPAGYDDEEDCSRQNAPCGENRIYLIQSTRATARR